MNALNDLTISAIRRAQSQGGTVDPVEDWDAIAELDKLARAGTEPPEEGKLVFCDFPVRVGDVLLYRLSWAAMDWIVYCASNWFSEDSAMYDKALAWAHAHGRSPSVFRDCPDKQSASKAISRWAWSICAPWNQIMTAVDELIAELPKSKGKTNQSKATTSSLLDILIETHGGTVDYWMWEISIPAMMALTSAIQFRNNSEDADRSAMSGKAPDPNGEMVKAIIKFQRQAREFIQEIVSRSTQGVEGSAAKHGGMEKTQKVNGCPGSTAISEIGKNGSQKPDGKGPVDQ